MEHEITHQSLSLLAGVAINQGTENAIIHGSVDNISNIDVIDGQHISKIVEIEYITTDDQDKFYVTSTRTHGHVHNSSGIANCQSMDLGMVNLQENSALSECKNNNRLPNEHMEEDYRGILRDGVIVPYSKVHTLGDSMYRKCFLCNVVYDTKVIQDLFDDNNKRCHLLELLNTYIFSPQILMYVSTEEYPVCQMCVDKTLNWHSFYTKIKSVQKHFLPADHENSDHLSKSKMVKTYFQPTGTKKHRFAILQNQIKNVLYNSTHHHLIKRNLSEENFDYIAERLFTTKSNSSVKIKEIGKLIGEDEKILSIFCIDCGKSIIGGKDNYKSHRLEDHKDEQLFKYPCDLCGVYYPEKDTTGLGQNYFSHWILHFYFHECSTCKESFPNSPLLRRHEEIHKKRASFQCSTCDKTLANKVTLEKHIKTHLPDEEKRRLAKSCHICGKIITAPTLKAHIYSVHSNERPWKCEICGSTFKHKSVLTGHRNAVHLKIKNFHCKICSRSFGHHCGLRTHMAKHENRREHECNICRKKFITNWHLKKHLISHKTEKDVICQVCGKGFKTDDALQEHMTIHTGEKPHECHICGRKVRVLSNLYKHFLVHKKNKTYYSKKEAESLGNNSNIHRGHQTRLNLNAQRPSALPETYASDSQAIPEVATSEAMEVNEVLQVNRSKNIVTYPGPRISNSTSVIISKPSSGAILPAEGHNSVCSSIPPVVDPGEVVNKPSVIVTKSKPTEEMWNQICLNF